MKKICLFVLCLFILCNIQAQIITTIAGDGSVGFSGEGGPAISAQLNFLAGICSDKWDNIYIADKGNNVIQKIDTNGILSRFAGNGSSGDAGDGGPAIGAQLNMYVLVGLTTDTIGNVYIASGSSVRKVNTSGIITTVAGNGTYGYSGDGGPASAAQLAVATGLCIDKSGNLYIADEQNSKVRMVNTAGIISTIAGTTIGFSGDGGPATNAQLKSPDGTAIDDAGNLYFADGNNYRIRKINTSGIISTIAGVGLGSGPKVCYGCDALVMQLAPVGIAIDAYNNVYVSDIVSDVVHKITPDGKIYPIAGTGTEGYSGDRGPASSAQLYRPTMICLDKKGNLLIADKGNGRVRKVWLDGTVHTPPAPVPLPTSSTLLISPNPATQKYASCTVQSDSNESAALIITDMLGRVVSTASCSTNTATNISLPVPAGMYFISATTKSGKRMNAKIVIE